MIYSWTLLYQNNNNKSREENINSNFPCGIEYNFFISFFLYFFFTCKEVPWLTSSLMWIFLLKISKGNFLRWLFFISLETWHQIIACIYLCLIKVKNFPNSELKVKTYEIFRPYFDRTSSVNDMNVKKVNFKKGFF